MQSHGGEDQEKLEDVMQDVEVEEVPDDAPPIQEGFVEE
jgi:hypothetical protein